MKVFINILFCSFVILALWSCTPIIYTQPRPAPVVYEQPVAPVANPQPAPVVQQAPLTNQSFYDQLSPYGTWVNYPEYGYVWSPRVDYGFMPYSTNGHWLYTDQGWTWYSGYSWGWAPFHYGRWFYDNNYGWMWVPGNDWAPAWVVWGQQNSYYGWAPMEPGVTLFAGYSPPRHYWTFVPANQVNQPNVGYYAVNNTSRPNDKIVIINNNTNYNNAVYNGGPRREEVEKYTNSRIQPVKVQESNRPLSNEEISPVHQGKVSNNTVPLYRPAFDKSPQHQKVAPAPAKVEKIQNLKPVKKQPAKPVIKKENKQQENKERENEHK